MINRRSRYRTTKSEINIVPLLDVLLVLVLIFMATAPIISQSVEVDLPDAVQSKTVSVTDTTPVIIEVSDQGVYTLIIDQERQTDLSSEQIVAEVKNQLATNDKTLFLVGGAKTVPYEDIINALNMLQTAGVNSVSLMTQTL